MPVVILIIVMIAVFFTGGLLVEIAFGDADYDISDFGSRIVLIVLAFGPPLIPVLILAKRFDRPNVNLSKAARVGALAGFAFSVGWFILSGIEFANGSNDSDAETISVRIIGIAERSRSRPYMLVVEDWHEPGGRSQLFWGPNYPEGWDEKGNCLHARTGPGAYGFRWIGDQKIAPCKMG